MGFYNSHQVLHFAMFFIDARAKVLVAESHFDSLYALSLRCRLRMGHRGMSNVLSIPYHFSRRGSLVCASGACMYIDEAVPRVGTTIRPCSRRPPTRVVIRFSGLLVTLQVADRPHHRDPNTLPEHVISRNDERCVQKAEM